MKQNSVLLKGFRLCLISFFFKPIYKICSWTQLSKWMIVLSLFDKIHAYNIAPWPIAENTDSSAVDFWNVEFIFSLYKYLIIFHKSGKLELLWSVHEMWDFLVVHFQNETHSQCFWKMYLKYAIILQQIIKYSDFSRLLTKKLSLDQIFRTNCNKFLESYHCYVC